MSEKLTSEEIVGLAQASPAFGNLIKIAINGANFNENVPATGGAPDESGGSGYPSNNAPAGQVPPPTPPEEEEGYAAVPAEEAPVEEPPADTPEAVGARAAQTFLGPIMDGAMQGDPSAQDIVAKAAGSVAGAVAEAYSKSMAGSPAVAGEVGAAAPELTPPVMTSPEEDMANQIVGEQQPPAPPAAPGAPVPPAAPGAPAATPVPGKKPEGEEEELDENGQPKKKKSPFPPKKQ